VSSYIAARAGGHFTAKEFRTWNATVLMALTLANAGPSPTARTRRKVIAAGVRQVADWLGDTPTVTRSAYIDPRLISRYESDGELPAVPALPAALPAPAEAELAVATLLTESSLLSAARFLNRAERLLNQRSTDAQSLSGRIASSNKSGALMRPPASGNDGCQ
jgi:hypothetical protein